MNTRSDGTLPTLICFLVCTLGCPVAAESLRPFQTYPSMFAQVSSQPDPVHGSVRHRNTPQKSRWRWDGEIALRTFYDNNILDYSDRDRNLFLDRTRPNKFSINTLDDWVSELDGRIERRYGTRSHGEYRMRVTAEANLYSRNEIKNSVRYEFEGRWAHKTTLLMVHVGWVPHFYLRDLIVHDSTGTTPGSPLFANADYHAWSADLEYRASGLWSTEQRLSTGWKNTDYGRRFDERDNTTWWGRYRLVIPLAARWSGVAGYEYASMAATGANGSWAVTDVSRREQTVVLGIDYDIPRSLSVSVDVAYEHQRYTSTKPADPSHAGRRDNEWRIYLEGSAPFGDGWRLAGFDRWTTATSTTGQSSEFGAFDNNQIGIRVAHTW